MAGSGSQALEAPGTTYQGYTLASHFQPIVAIAYSQVFGAEALLRASDAHGNYVPPLELFARASARQEGHALDAMAQDTHLKNFRQFAGGNRWLFMNCRPETLILRANERSTLEETVARNGFSPAQIVIELLEDAALSNHAVTTAIAALQTRGFRVAIDDFGTGSSNLDRVWGVQPDFVKLDRSLVRRASLSRDDRRVAKMLVSMLHKMGALVVAEGVETPEEGLAVMDADVDFVQGFLFARPQADLTDAIGSAEQAVADLWPQLSALNSKVSAQEFAKINAVRLMLLSAVKVLRDTDSLEQAAHRFFMTPETISLFLVDADGIQMCPVVKRQSALREQRFLHPEIAPSGTNWSRRPYYKDAIRRPGFPSIYGPHSSILDGAFVYTIAVTVDAGEYSRVLCGNFRMSATEFETAT